jgi:hypothetical protein
LELYRDIDGGTVFGTYNPPGSLSPKKQTGGPYTVSHTFRIWYAQWLVNCGSGADVTPIWKYINVINSADSSVDICVNDTVVHPGEVWIAEDIAFAGQYLGPMPFLGTPHTTVEVEYDC